MVPKVAGSRPVFHPEGIEAYSMPFFYLHYAYYVVIANEGKHNGRLLPKYLNMKILNYFLTLFLFGVLITSCQKDELVN